MVATSGRIVLCFQAKAPGRPERALFVGGQPVEPGDRQPCATISTTIHAGIRWRPTNAMKAEQIRILVSEWIHEDTEIRDQVPFRAMRPSK